MSELRNNENTYDNCIPEIREVIGKFMETGSPEIGLFQSEELIPEIFFYDCNKKKDYIKRDESISDDFLNSRMGRIFSFLEFIFRAQIDDTKIVESMKEDISEREYKK